MTIGFLFHCMLPSRTIYFNFFECLSWFGLVYLIIISSQIKSKLIFAFAISLFILNNGISFVERYTETRFFEYDSEILEGFASLGDMSRQEFRSFALLGHPLTNACITSLFMGFILVSNQLSKYIKVALLMIGMLGLYGFNSRGAIAIWIVIILYRFLLYDKSFLRAILPLIFIAMSYPFIFEYISSGEFGRFTLDFTDDSTKTIIMSFVYFANQEWNLETILLGGRYIEMPGTDLLLENGILLNLSYWGWLVDELKTILEIFVSYIVLRKRPKQEIFIILFSFWGVALTNNIIIGVLPLTYFLLTYSALNTQIINRLNNIKNENII